MNGRGTFKAFVEEVRDRSDLVAVIGRDVDLRRAGSTLKGLSPFHIEKHASFVVWPATQTWHDYSNGGGLGGDVFTYVQEREKVGFKEAVFLLAERAGLRRPNQGDASWKRELAAATERREVERLLGIAAKYYHSRLPDKIRDQFWKQRYGFTDETIDQLQLGWADGHLFDHLIAEAGRDRSQALKTGLFVVLAGGRVVDLFRNRLVFPYWRGGRVVYFTARRTEYTGDEAWEESKYKKLLTHSDEHSYVSPTVRNDFFFNEDAAQGADELVITEGTPDCISAMQAGVACISTSTTSFRGQDLPRLLELSRHAKRIIICNDAEKSGAGEVAAAALAAALWNQGREVCIAAIPRPEGIEKIDVNELVFAHGPEALRAVLSEAKSYPDYLLDRIPADTPKADLDRLLEPVLLSLTGCSPIRADVVFDAITAKLGVRRKALNEHRKALTQKKRAPTEASAIGTAAATATVATHDQLPAEDRPQICVTKRDLRDLVADAHAVLVQANGRRIQRAATGHVEGQDAPLFRRGNVIVRLERDEDVAPMLSDVTETAIYGVLLREIAWLKTTDEGPIPAYPPDKVAMDLLTYPGSTFPRVSSVIATPTFGRAGQLLHQPGLHQADRLWLDPDPSLRIGHVPDQPTADDVVAARSLFFDDLLVDFPFVAPSDRAHALAALLLPFMRRLIDGSTPLHVVEAPAVGAGKGLLCNLVGLLVTGEDCSARTLPDSEDEIRKMLTAELSTARSIILLDNANDQQTLSSPALASVLTASSWTDRVLGRTQMVTVPNKAMWMLTGTNPKLSRDIARRSIRIRIDPKVDRAWLRAKFKHDPLEAWTKAHRGELVRAALVLVQAWIAAGRPLSHHRLGSFQRWATVMGGVLNIAGVEGFLGNANELYDSADTDGQAWREFTQAWWEECGNAETHASALAELCEKRDLMSQVRGDGNARSQQIRLGRALQSARDRVFGDLEVIVGKRDRTKRASYALKRIEEASSPIADASEHEGNGGDDERRADDHSPKG